MRPICDGIANFWACVYKKYYAVVLAKTMKWKGKNPVVKVVDKVYETGVRLSKSAMRKYEEVLTRFKGLENWFVNILCFDQEMV